MKLKNNFIWVRPGLILNEDHIVAFLGNAVAREVEMINGTRHTLSVSELEAVLKVVGPVCAPEEKA